VWGVVHNGRRAYAAAGAALSRFRQGGGRVVLLTNVPKPRGPIPAQLEAIGVPRSAWDVIVTSGDAIRVELNARAPGPMLRIGPEEFDRPLFEGLHLSEAPLDRARFVAVSGLTEEHETPEDYAQLLAAARARDLEMICANPDIVVRVGEKLVWCAGALARDYAKLGGRVVMAGKPHAAIYALAYRELEALGVKTDKARILCIGDGVTTDVVGAAREGLDCLFIADGIHGESLKDNGALAPAKVAAALAAEGVGARYVMGALS
jgi:HAD superfamily hydrolase (TIGR01459 family)